MRQTSETLRISADGPGFRDFTAEAQAFVAKSGISDGLFTCFIRHTSASLLIQENADPDVLRDLEDYFAKLAPESRHYRHDAEGPDDMPSHLRTALTAVTLSIPVQDGRLALGTWQALYLFEHRAAPHRREILLHLIGE